MMEESYQGSGTSSADDRGSQAVSTPAPTPAAVNPAPQAGQRVRRVAVDEAQDLPIAVTPPPAQAASSAGRSGGNGNRACHKCGRLGHIAAACRSGSSPRKCHTCGKTGHLAKACRSSSSGTRAAGAADLIIESVLDEAVAHAGERDALLDQIKQLQALMEDEEGKKKEALEAKEKERVEKEVAVLKLVMAKMNFKYGKCTREYQWWLAGGLCLSWLGYQSLMYYVAEVEHVEYFLLFAALTACLLVAVLRTKRIMSRWVNNDNNSYRVTSLHDEQHADLRPNLLGVGSLKYARPFYATVEHTGPDPRDPTSTITTDLNVSLELFSHLAVSKYMPLGGEELDVWRGLKFAADGFCAMNLNRYKSFEGKNIVQDTCLLVFGAWKAQCYNRRFVPFPSGPRSV